ncbi:MAG TPA: hypothetical protein VHW24_20205 [Bryobacteraceae bacterium]|nr:hypothetical protein [Bryobacteraceae bacterium]
MPEFRKCILALAGVALFSGLASAQVTSNQLTCTTANGAVPPTLRSEGYTELSGDIVISCTGGTALPLGSVVPTANFTVFLATNVTSRLLTSTITTGAATVSEALLMIDEPNSGLLNSYGPLVPQSVCGQQSPNGFSTGAGAGGCTEYVGVTTINGTNFAGVPVNTPPSLNITTGTQVQTEFVAGTTPTVTTVTCTSVAPCATPTTTGFGANVFNGLVQGNSVSFYGIPILPPATAGDSRVFRITNIRANTNGLVAGGTQLGQLNAQISISSASSLALNNATLTVGFVEPGLNQTTTGLRNTVNGATSSGTAFAQCSNASLSNSSGAAGVIQFQENFATAFKTRYDLTTVATVGTTQNKPGTLYNSESGLILPISSVNSATGGTSVAGQADYGTRLKATFYNVPSGVSIYVTTRDVINNFSVYAGTPNAVLVVSETAPDSGAVPPAVSQTSTFGVQNGGSASAVGIAPVALSAAGSGAAVWEVISTNPATIDTLNFGVYLTYTASPSTNSPASPGNIAMALSFAPTPALLAPITATQYSQASAVYTIPRFSDSLDIFAPLARFTLCQTDLLFPYITNAPGFDTGIAIANTTTDPFGTLNQQGICNLYFYGTSAPTNPYATTSIATGTTGAWMASTIAPGFTGYMIAVCNFQYAHGYAFVADAGIRNFATSYLPLILTNGTAPTRSVSAGENLNN